MKHTKKFILIILLSVLLAGCVNKDIVNNGNNTNATREDMITIKYLEDNGQVISNSDFKLISRQKLIAPINLSNSLETESVHGGMVLNASEDNPKGFRTYGYSETYISNKTKSYTLVQYKLFDNDNNNDLNNSIDLTTNQYVANGFKTKIINANDIKFKGRVILLEANSSANVTNVPKDMNVDIILFGNDTLIGKIGVEDYKNISMNESIKVLNEFSEKLKTNTREEVADNNFNIHV